MKKLYIFLFVALPFYNSFSQTTLAEVLSLNPSLLNRELAMGEFLSKNILSLQPVLDSTLSWTWNEAWVIRKKVISNYDDQGRLAEQISYTRDGSIWEYFARVIYNYNTSEITEVVYIFETDIWSLNSQNIYSYDIYGNLIQFVHQTWSGAEWINFSMVSQEFNSQFQPIMYLTSVWGSDMWIPESRTLSTYSLDGLLAGTLYQFYENGEWVDNFRQTYTYDTLDRFILVETQVFDGMVWRLSGQLIYEYGNGTKTLTYQAYQLMQWENIMQVTSIYDMDDNLFSEVLRFWNDEWTNSDSTQYYYSELSASHDMAASSGIVLYPNPSSNSLTIDLSNFNEEEADLHIYSIQGTEEMQLSVNTQAQIPIDVSNLPSGQYILRINSKDHNRIGRFIKE